MTSKRLYLVFIGLTVLLFVGLLGGVYGTNKLLASRAQELTSFKAKSAALEKQQEILNKDKKDIAQYSELQKIIQQIVPQEKNQAAAVRELVNVATANGVTITSITFPASTLGETKAKAPSSGKATSTAPKAPSLNSPSVKLSQLKPVSGIAGVYQLVINIENDGSHLVSYGDFISFLSALEKNRHTAQVSTIDLQPSEERPGFYTFNLSITEYVRP